MRLMTTPYARAMQEIVRETMPLFKAAGFRKRRYCFNRHVEAGMVQVNFPMGPHEPLGRWRSHRFVDLNLYGKFAVNLGVYVPEMMFEDWQIAEGWVNETPVSASETTRRASHRRCVGHLVVTRRADRCILGHGRCPIRVRADVANPRRLSLMEQAQTLARALPKATRVGGFISMWAVTKNRDGVATVESVAEMWGEAERTHVSTAGGVPGGMGSNGVRDARSDC